MDNKKKAFVINDPATHLLEQFNRRYPEIPVTVSYSYAMNHFDPIAICREAQSNERPGVHIVMNPHRSYVDLATGLTKALGVASYWTPGHGLPEEVDEMVGKERAFIRDLKFT